MWMCYLKNASKNVLHKIGGRLLAVLQCCSLMVMIECKKYGHLCNDEWSNHLGSINGSFEFVYESYDEDDFIFIDQNVSERGG